MTIVPVVHSQRPPQPVEVGEIVEREAPSAMRLVGSVLADKRAVVAADVDGLVMRMPADDGLYVRAGEVLCELDDELARLRLLEGEAELARLQADLLEIRNGEREEVRARLRAAVGEAEAIHRMWKLERDRIESLFKNRQANAKEMQDAESEYVAAERRLAQRQAEYQQAETGARVEEIARAQHSVEAQAAVVERLKRDLRRAKITAPFDGYVISRATEVGAWVARGGQVCEMVSIERVRIRADAPERVIPFARVGTDARLEFEAIGATRTGTISRVIPSATPAARTFPLEIDLENADHALLPGMFVWAFVPSGPSGARLLAPRDAIVAQGASKTIFVVREMGGVLTAMPVSVVTGLELDGLIAIEGEGLHAGLLVVTRANERLFGPTPVAPNNLSSPVSAPAAASSDPPEATESSDAPESGAMLETSEARE